MEAVTGEETRKVLIGEDPQQKTRPKKRLAKYKVDFLPFVLIFKFAVVSIL